MNFSDLPGRYFSLNTYISRIEFLIFFVIGCLLIMYSGHINIFLSCFGFFIVFYATYKRMSAINQKIAYLYDLCKISVLVLFSVIFHKIYDIIFPDKFDIIYYLIFSIPLVWSFVYLVIITFKCLFRKNTQEYSKKDSFSFEKFIQNAKKFFINAFKGLKSFFKNFFNFKDTCTRSEFFIPGLISITLLTVTFYYNFLNYFFYYYVYDFVFFLKGVFPVIIIFLLFLSLYIRRLRDLKLSPWFILSVFLMNIFFPAGFAICFIMLLGKNNIEEKPADL